MKWLKHISSRALLATALMGVFRFGHPAPSLAEHWFSSGTNPKVPLKTGFLLAGVPGLLGINPSSSRCSDRLWRPLIPFACRTLVLVRHNPKIPLKTGFSLAGVPGLEPRRTESESAILPLDDTPTKKMYLIIHLFS